MRSRLVRKILDGGLVVEDRLATIASREGYEALIEDAGAVLHMDRTFPDQVLRHGTGSLRWTDGPYVGWALLRDFAMLHGDDRLYLISVPPSTQIKSAYDPEWNAALTLATELDESAAETAMATRSGFFLGAPLVYFGDSKRWAVFGEYDLAAWWSDLPADNGDLADWEMQYRPWAYSVAGAAELWGLAFPQLGGLPDDLLRELEHNYGRFDRADREEGLADLPINERRLGSGGNSQQ